MRPIVVCKLQSFCLLNLLIHIAHNHNDLGAVQSPAIKKCLVQNCRTYLEKRKFPSHFHVWSEAQLRKGGGHGWQRERGHLREDRLNHPGERRHKSSTNEDTLRGRTTCACRYVKMLLTYSVNEEVTRFIWHSGRRERNTGWISFSGFRTDALFLCPI